MPRMYFIGVTTGQSSIHNIFPRWAALAGVNGAALEGIDIPVGGPPELYRAAVRRIREDPEGCGALVTTHKVGIYEHAGDLFDELDGDAEMLGEVSCIVKRSSCLTGIAIDTLTAGLALKAIWAGRNACPTLILGSGGAGVALAVHICREYPGSEVILTDVSSSRLERVRRLVPGRCELVSGPEGNDLVLEAMPPASLIVNATGMGKDRPGSPITHQARFPRDAVAWDFNYRGELRFLESARTQGVKAVDGWEFFLHGWSQIMSRVFGFKLTPGLFEAMRGEAARA